MERIDRLARGDVGDAGDVKPIGKGVSELRLTYGPGYRVHYLQEADRLVLLLCGGDKSTQQGHREGAPARCGMATRGGQ